MRHLRMLLLVSAVALRAAESHAGPAGGTVVGGSASISGQGSGTVTVNQSSGNAIINWQTFNVGSGQSIQFVQPNASSVTLNRVIGGEGPSQVFGTITANGKVFLINPDGVLFGGGAVVRTSGFLASTSDIRNDDFMAGRYRFTIPGNPNASIVNLGTITAINGGFAALVAPGVRNAGTITASLGKVAMASSNGFTLDFYGDKLITLQVGDQIAGQVIDVATGKPLKALVSNEGKIRANGGRVELTAAAARQVVDAVISNTGVIEANTVGERGGTIVLSAATSSSKPAGAPQQTIRLSGTMSAAGKKKGTKGGTIVVSGENIEVNSAKIDASGRVGGGAVMIGGDWGGGNPNRSLVSNQSAQLSGFAVPTASTVTVDAASRIDASAKDAGNGGKVILWSDQQTTFAGTILARGGPNGGNGGFVEVSSRHDLGFDGIVDTSAPNGRRGVLLLDPQDVTIGVNVSVASLQAALASGDVTIATDPNVAGNGDITVAQSFSWASGAILTLRAYRDITINNGVTITNSGAGFLNLHADSTGIGIGAVTFIGTAKVDFSNSTGFVSIFYNPQFGYVFPLDYSPFVLTNGAVPDQLRAYMLVNSVNDLQHMEQNLSGNYALGRDIDASATAGWNGGAGFIPIGSTGFGFNGNFDGQFHVIDRLTINSTAPQVGLFSSTGFNTTISNVGITNVAINGANAYTGAIVGVANGTVVNSYSSGSVSGANAGGLVGFTFGNIIESHSSVAVSGSVTAGGLAGSIGPGPGGRIDHSYATGSVVGNLYAGGLVGQFAGGGTISQSFATGSVSGGTTASPVGAVGGLVGFVTGPGAITQSYATGSVTGGANSSVGGLIGELVGLGGPISEVYATGLVAGGSHAGGLVGSATGTYSITNAYWDVLTTGQSSSIGQAILGGLDASVGLTTTQLTAGLPAGFDPTVWSIKPGQSYPYFPWQPGGTIPIVPVPNPGPTFPITPLPTTQTACIACVIQTIQPVIVQDTNFVANFGKKAGEWLYAFGSDVVTKSEATLMSWLPKTDKSKSDSVVQTVATDSAKSTIPEFIPEPYAKALGAAVTIYDIANVFADLTVGLSKDQKSQIKNQLPAYVDTYVEDVQQKPLSKVIDEVAKGHWYVPIPRWLIKKMLLNEASKEGLHVMSVDE